MDGNILDPDGARAHLAAWKGRIDKMAEDTEAMRNRLQEVRVTVHDRHGLAEVSVDSTGSLVGLRLTERIARVTPDVVAEAIMATLGEARNQVADRSKEIIAETVGTESPAARAIAQSVDRHLRGGTEETPATPQAAPAGAQRTRGRAADTEDDGDFEYDIQAQFRE